jgi:hypothetical protein
VRLEVSQHIDRVGTVRNVRLSDMDGREDIHVFYEVQGEQLPEPGNLDGFVFGIIFFAMAIGEDITVAGPLSFDCLANLREFQDAWCSWRPNSYKKVDLVPTRVDYSLRAADIGVAIAAFSGGVDSVFTVLRHNRRELGDASYPLHHSVAMVQGFDVPLDSPDEFAALEARVDPLLTSLGLKLIPIRTNLKQVVPQHWEDSFLAQLASCLHNLSHRFDYSLVASGQPYDALNLPWGSNPATDHLLSGSAMRIVLDGAGSSRTEKVARIARDPIATQALKVCWEGERASANCGQCEKCVRTQLNFLAVGSRHAACFDEALDIHSISRIELRNDIQFAELQSIYQYGDRPAADEQWRKILGRRLWRYRLDRLAGSLRARLRRRWAAVFQ